SKGVLLGKVSPADAPIAGPGGLAAHGVALESCARCLAIDREARALLLEDGRRLPYSTLVIATGSLVRELPNLPIGMPHVHYLRTEADAQRLLARLRDTPRLLVVGAGLVVDEGIIVDEYCRTSDRAIFAAGDVVRFPGPHGPVRLENWRHAQDQGAVAGRNAAGASEAYRTIPSFWSEQYDLYIQGVG